MIRNTLLCSAALVFALLASPALADDDCKPIREAIKKMGEAVMKTDPKTPPAMCAAFGQVVGLTSAMREVAEHCMDEGAERDALMKDMTETSKAMREEIDKQCK